MPIGTGAALEHRLARRWHHALERRCASTTASSVISIATATSNSSSSSNTNDRGAINVIIAARYCRCVLRIVGAWRPRHLATIVTICDILQTVRRVRRICDFPMQRR